MADLLESLGRRGHLSRKKQMSAVTAALNWHNGRRAGTLLRNPGHSPDRELQLNLIKLR